MRRFLAIVGLILVTAGFVLIPLSIMYNINFLIPIGLIAAAFLILLYVKKLPSDLDEKEKAGELTSDAQALTDQDEEGNPHE